MEPIVLPTERERLLDPPAGLRELRERAPVAPLRFPDGQTGWLVTGWALGRELLVDQRFSVGFVVTPIGDPVAGAEIDRIERSLPEGAGVLIMLDPPQHTKIRRASAGYFTVRAIAGWEPVVERIVSSRLDAMEEAASPVDLVQTFALPISSFTICELLGVPHEDRERFERPSAALVDPRLDAEAKRAALVEFYDYCREVMAKKRASPRDDVLSDLVAKSELSEDEMVGLARQLFEAGHETTAAQLSLSVVTLLLDRARWDSLRSNPSLIGNAVEELLRYLSILQLGTFSRTALEDVELGGVVIAEGERVIVSVPAANRDPKKFAAPDAVDFTRRAGGHLAFGHGKHMCVGQHLARMELKVALRGLLERFPNLELDVPVEELHFLGGEHVLFGIEELPVAW